MVSPAKQIFKDFSSGKGGNVVTFLMELEQMSYPEALRWIAKKYNIDYLEHKNVNSDEFISIIEKFKCDLFVSMSFNQIFKKRIINLPKYKIINCHAGKLPFYRGRNILACTWGGIFRS